MIVAALAIAVGAPRLRAAAEHVGQVTFAGTPVPGAMVTALLGDKQIITFTNQDGLYRLADLADGTWTLKIELRGFAPLTKEITIASGTPQEGTVWELMLLPFDEITRGLPPPRPAASAPPATSAGTSPAQSGNGNSRAASGGRNAAAAPAAPTQQGFQRAGVTAAPRPAAAAGAAAAPEPPADAAAANDGFLINGSVNNGAASPFAQLAAFGNNRRRPGALYNAQFAMVGGTSAWDARSASLTGRAPSIPSYNNIHFGGMFQGPLRIPHLLQRNAPQLFVGYQGINDDNAITQAGRMPTALERAGDFSQTLDVLGRPVQIVDPVSGLPFAGGVIPRDRLSPQAMSLLNYYPQPTINNPLGSNYQAPIISSTRMDSVQSRITQIVNQRNQVLGTAAYQRTSTDTRSLFGFDDTNESSGTDIALMWNRRFSQFLSMRSRYQFTQLSNTTTPFFANRSNVSGDAGITGNDQNPGNWGPPSLVFSTVAGLSDALPRYSRNRTNAGSLEGYLFRGRHNFTIGGEVKRNTVDLIAQQDPRGSFTFTGAATGLDFADFLLGAPSAASIAYGNADKYFRGVFYDAYISDDWRVGPSLTVTAGARWEYEGPFTEKYGRLVNLDVAPGFTAVSQVLATQATGSLSGQKYPSSLMRPDKRGLQPRLAIAWRPVPGSSLVVRAGYGIYRNTNVYQSITTLLAQQPPLSTTLSVANSAANPLTLARGFIGPVSGTPNTFAVDPDFRVSSSQTWQVAVQRDLPASLTVNLTYLGTKGSNLIQEFLPNTYPAGSVNPCPTCPAGFVFLTSDGHSIRHAGQFQVRRRLRNGLTASVQYTLAKAEDDAASFQGANLSGLAFAQNWLDLDAEWGPSAFDQRHNVTAQFQYTTGVGVRGGTLLDGWRGALVKGWTLTGQLTTGSGLPLTPYYLTTTPGTGFSGAVRASLTGESTTASDGYYLNPLAYKRPDPGTWGNAGRNSVRGPSQFSFNAGVTRSFPWGSRYNLDWRIDATNVLNRVTYATVNTLIGSPEFGLPTNTNQMR
jgi:Carboxypeptidase regulatory-like domain